MPMRNNSPDAVSLNDAASLILNMSYQPGNTDLLEMVSFFRKEAQSKKDHAETIEEKNCYSAQESMHTLRALLVNAILDALDAEVAKIHAGQHSVIVIDDQAGPGAEKLVTASVLAWAADIGFGIDNWTPPRFWRRRDARSYSTEYLDILDDVITTWFEESGAEHEAGKTPKKAALKTWVENKYGHVSDKVLDAMATIVIQEKLP